MDETFLNGVCAEVLRRLTPHGPRALLIGAAPAEPCGYQLVKTAPYEAVVVGSLSAAQLLSPPQELLQALLEGKPVLLNEAGLCSRSCDRRAPRLLLTRLQEAERQLRQWGARPLVGQDSRLITAAEARRLRDQGGTPPARARMTPLAREILGGE